MSALGFALELRKQRGPLRRHRCTNTYPGDEVITRSHSSPLHMMHTLAHAPHTHPSYCYLADVIRVTRLTLHLRSAQLAVEMEQNDANDKRRRSDKYVERLHHKSSRIQVVNTWVGSHPLWHGPHPLATSAQTKKSGCTLARRKEKKKSELAMSYNEEGSTSYRAAERHDTQPLYSY
ncbi:hypothetical protein LSM04_001948 [Trypanosoma melophagium]|uniref:uncharacterized protein n=1 Tax=Trypanosoma melophagium TaxID=715481 RepID=UPI00351A2BA0|nr:hypothetical protein LSM04_001948 [Trypanosoma melophagium]